MPNRRLLGVQGKTDFLQRSGLQNLPNAKVNVEAQQPRVSGRVGGRAEECGDTGTTRTDRSHPRSGQRPENDDDRQ